MWMVVTFCCLSAGLAAIWFIYLQAFVLKHLCAYCLTAHLCGLFLAIVTLWKHPIGLKAGSMPSFAAIAGLLVLIAGQALGPEPVTYTIESYETQPVSTHADPGDTEIFGAPTENDGGIDGLFAPPSDDFIFEPPTAPDVSKVAPTRSSQGPGVSGLFQLAFQPMLMNSFVTFQQPADQGEAADQGEQAEAAKPAETKPQEPRRLARIGSNIKLDVKQWPLCGSPDAKYVFVEMFDYSCPHCRRTHQLAIQGAKERFGKELAIIALPLPLNTNCNNAIVQTGPKFLESCEIAKLAIAVWRVDPSKFNDFHNWMFSGETKTFASTLAHAQQLVDSTKLNNELNSSMVAGYVNKHVQIYNMVGRGEVPKLLFPSTSVVGEMTSRDALIDIIERQGPLVPTQ